MDTIQNGKMALLGRDLSFLGSGSFFVDIAVALACGLLIALFYRWTYSERKYSLTFANSLVSLTMITCVVITVVGNDLARAFGLVGALSIIRFRLAVKDMQDIVFVFFALAVGLAAGVGLSLTAVASAVIIGCVILVLSRRYGGSMPAQPFTLRVSTLPGAGDAALYRPIIEKYCARSELRKSRRTEEDRLELVYAVALAQPERVGELVAELGQSPGVAQVVLDKAKSGKKEKSLRKKSIE